MLLPDTEVARIEANVPAAGGDELRRYVRALVADRCVRSAIILGEARRLAFARKRLKQAHAYLDGLLAVAADDTRVPWPGQLPCDHCGAPAQMIRAEQRAQGHALVTDHPDGVRCEGPATTLHRAPR